MRCDSPENRLQYALNRVSIPAGFSDALRPYSRGETGVVMEFQSLLGFLMRCDLSVEEGRQLSVRFQSLLGFLMRCD